MKKTCYVTTPIYYASGNVHIGNSYTTIVCDAFARFHRLLGHDTKFLTGMDEHGQKIAEAALKKGLAPQELVDLVAGETKQLWQELNISFDDFIRTTEERHVKVVQKIFEQLLASGDIYLGNYEGDYCVSCEAFFTKTQMKEANTCPDCGKPTRVVQDRSYFLRLTKYQQALLDYIEAHPDFIQPATRKNEVVAFVERGLEDLCVSRTSFQWGIPVLSDPKHVVYVWIDALANYLSALGFYSDNDADYQKYWVNGDTVIHVVGKDILRFHAIYWPILLMALQVPIRFKLMVHGWVLMKEGKMSKSSGNFIYPHEIIDRYGLDAFRLFMTKEMPLGNDMVFTYERFFEKYNVDLANDLGNLVSRTIAMANKYFNGQVEKPIIHPLDVELELEQLAQEVFENYQSAFSGFRFQSGLMEVWNLINRTNKLIDETLPWDLAKDPLKKDVLNSVLYHLLESIRVIALMLLPVIPDTAKIIFHELGLEESDFSTLSFGLTNTFQVVKKARVLFKRLDIEEELKFQASKQTPIRKTSPIKAEITIDEFNKVDLRVGVVVDAKHLEGSNNLLVLQVQVEDKIRQIVSGIAQDYNPSQLIGKKIVVVANLKPAKVRGAISEGMLLAASGDGLPFEVVELQNHDSYSKVS
ncbi:MAG: Methionine--tRNA ligase [Tenericutes bacterium ADurb.BinA124]|nr:MAG: Methionine--tRNA ligase [Tenericutes bacterium ADurb.BinA124]